MQTILKLLCITVSAVTCAAMATDSPEPQKPEPSTHAHLNAKGKKIGHNPAQARCVIDKQSGLVWELKTADDSIHNKDKVYRWGGAGAEKIGTIFFNDWNSLIDGTNKEKLCGFSDWRVPTIDELKTLIANNQQGLKIDTHYFFDTKDSAYWSSSAYSNYPEHAQTVHFGNGNAHYYNGYKGDGLPLRLVRGKLTSQAK